VSVPIRVEEYWVEHTSLVFPEFDLLFQFKLVRIHFSVEAVVFLENTGQAASSCVDGAPVSNRFSGIDFRNYIFKMLLAE
jgi:hypothetical protein